MNAFTLFKVDRTRKPVRYLLSWRLDAKSYPHCGRIQPFCNQGTGYLREPKLYQ